MTARTAVVITGTPDQIIELFRGPQQHNAHCGGWRWHLYMQDNAKRLAAMRAEGLRMIAEAHAAREARERFAEAAE